MPAAYLDWLATHLDEVDATLFFDEMQEILNRPAKHGVLPGSVAELKCTGENYTGRIWELVSVLVFAQVSTVTP